MKCIFCESRKLDWYWLLETNCVNQLDWSSEASVDGARNLDLRGCFYLGRMGRTGTQVLDFTAKSRSDPSIQMKLNTKRTYLTLQHMSFFPAGMTHFR